MRWENSHQAQGGEVCLGKNTNMMEFSWGKAELRFFEVFFLHKMTLSHQNQRSVISWGHLLQKWGVRSHSRRHQKRERAVSEATANKKPPHIINKRKTFPSVGKSKAERLPAPLSHDVGSSTENLHISIGGMEKKITKPTQTIRDRQLLCCAKC